MEWVMYNPNPTNRHVGDCAVRATSKALDLSWEDAYLKLCVNGYVLGDIPNSNEVMSETLKQAGFERHFIENTCPDCYTVKDFCEDYPEGNYVVFSSGHVLCVKDGNYYDAWDSGDKPVYFYFSKEEVNDGV